MQVAAEKLSPVLLELAVEVDAQTVTSELGRAYSRIAKSARIPGFRPGKAPRAVLAHVYGARVEQDVAQRLVDETYQKALAAQNVQAVSQPAIETQKIKDNAPFAYKARVEIVPDIAEVKFEGFEIKKPSTKASEAAITEELKALRRANSTLVPISEERPAKAGDVVTVDFQVFVENKQVTDAAATDFEVEIGANNVLPEIEDALLDSTPGDTKEALVLLPGTHNHPELRGKPATFKLTVKELKERHLPEADDEFAKDLDFDSLADLKASLQSDIEKRLAENADNALAEALVQQLVSANPIELPPALVQQQYELEERQARALLKARGHNVQGLPEQQRAALRADSAMKVHAGLLMAAIAKSQNIKIGDAEIEEGLKQLAEESGKNVAKLRAEYRDAKKREMLIGMILENKVLELLQSKATITESEETPS